MNFGIDLFTSQPVSSSYQGWLSSVFEHPQTQDALLSLIQNGMSDQRFVDSSVTYGLKLVSHSLAQQTVVDASAQLVNNTFKNDERVAAASGELCSWIVQQPEALSLSAAAL